MTKKEVQEAISKEEVSAVMAGAAQAFAPSNAVSPEKYNALLDKAKMLARVCTLDNMSPPVRAAVEEIIDLRFL